MKIFLITSKKEYRYWFIFSHQKYLSLYTTKDRNREPLTTKNPQNTDVWLWKRKFQLVVLVWFWYKWGRGRESQQKTVAARQAIFQLNHISIYIALLPHMIPLEVQVIKLCQVRIKLKALIWYWVTKTVWCQTNPEIHFFPDMHNVQNKTKNHAKRGYTESLKIKTKKNY